MSTAAAFEDAFNMLCGREIGRGIHRTVFACKLLPDMVIKVEDDTHRYFANVAEMKFWNDHMHAPQIAKWLAPCEFLSPDGRILIQRRADPCSIKQLPRQVPAFLTDLKRENWGMIDGKPVCIDYAMTIPNPSMRLKRADW